MKARSTGRSSARHTLVTGFEGSDQPVRPVPRADLARLILETIERRTHFREVLSVST